MSYKVQFLDDDLFDQLPGSNMETKVGVAYPHAGLAFARRSGIPVMDAMTALHELEHLKGSDLDERIDPEHGCYYKDFMSTLAPIALGFALPGIGAALGPAMGGLFGGLGSALSGAGSSIAGGLGSIPGIGGALEGGAQAIGAPLAGMGNSIGGALGIGKGAASATPGLDAWGVPSVSSGGEEAASLGGQLGPGALATPSMGEGALGAASSIPTGSMGGGSQFGNSLMNSLFSGGQQNQQQMPNFSMGSFQPNVIDSPQANMIPGGSGSGPGGVAGGGPGLGGGGQVKKLTGALQSAGNTTGGQK